MLHKFLFFLAKHKIIKPPKLSTYAVEMQVILDENTILHRFVAEIQAPSKRSAKDMAKARAHIKTGVVAKKTHILKYNKK